MFAKPRDRRAVRVLLAACVVVGPSWGIEPGVEEPSNAVLLEPDGATPSLLRGGAAKFHVDHAGLAAIGVTLEIRGDFDACRLDENLLSVKDSSRVLLFSPKGEASSRDRTNDDAFAALHLRGAIHLSSERAGFALRDPVIVASRSSGASVVSPSSEDRDGGPTLDLVLTALEHRSGTHRFALSGDIVLNRIGALRLGRPDLVGLHLGRLESTAELVAPGDGPGGESKSDMPDPLGPIAAAIAPGPDIIVAEIYNILNYGVVNGLSAIAIGTISCNVGTGPAVWDADTNQHPVIAQNMYRLENDRFEQIGMSWLKHGFYATSGTTCSSLCVGTNGETLGVNCSDPYSATLNGAQSTLGPRWQVNAFTGAFPYPPANPSYSGILPRRLQVRTSDLDQLQHSEAEYFLEAHYVTPDDAAAGNAYNNASHRLADVSGAGSSVFVQIASATVRQQPGIRAWKTRDPSVVETTVAVPGDGRFILSAKAKDLGGGSWEYEYALFNLNVHRAAASFRVPIDPTSTLTHIGFHDVDYHSGEPFAATDWTPTVSGVAIAWATTPYEVNQNANALRWSTLYNFRFRANAPPQGTTAIIGLFRPGTPTTVDAVTIGPVTNAADCNQNEIADSLDIQNQTSEDCNGNGIPDECESYGIVAQRILTGLNRPSYVAAPPGDATRLFVVEQGGVIRLRKSGTLLGAPFLDISGMVDGAGERGLTGLAFHPDYASNRKFYVSYNDPAGHTVIAQYLATSGFDTADAGSAVILKMIPQDSVANNGGHLQFGPDGMLYCGLGDSGAPNDPNGRGQDPASLLGKMLRLNVDNPPTYIPANNPYVTTTLPLHEIWAFGLRLPHRFGFDRETGELYLGDGGSGAWQEVNVQPATGGGGRNYGWRCMDGASCTGLSGCACQHSSLTAPIHAYADDAERCGVVGGFVYRGCAAPNLQGTYFFADRCSDEIFSLRWDGAAVSEWRPRQLELLPATGPIVEIVSFGEDAEGELYIVSSNGHVHKIVPTTSPPPVCGNEALEPGETCDDGNLLPGDGCDALCFLEPVETNDDCANALSITDGLHDFDTTDATTDGPSEPGACLFSGDAQVGSDIWFRYSATCRGTATFSLCGSAYNTKLAVYEGESCPTSATAIACDDNGCGGNQSRVALPVDACGQYLIRVGGFLAQRGAGTLQVTCAQTPLLNDCNANELDDAEDISCGRSSDGNGNLIPDECESPGDPVVGGRLYDNWWEELSVEGPSMDHPLWAHRPDSSSNAATGATTWRCKECHGWDYKGVDGQYGSGSHRTGFPGILGTSLSGGELFDLLREPPNNGGGPGVPNGHDYAAVLTDPEIYDLVAFVLGGALDGAPYISGAGAFIGDAEAGQASYLTSGAISCVTCHGSDGTAINFGTYSQPEYLGTIANDNPWEMLHKIRFGQPAAPMPSWIAGGGTSRGAADIGAFIQTSLPTECVEDEQCVDAVACTGDSCGPDGRCAFEPRDELCENDGLLCNGMERCDAALGCVSPGNPCSATCVEGQGCGCATPVAGAPGGRFLEISPRFTAASTPMAFVIQAQCAGSPPFWLGAPAGPHQLAPVVSSRSQAAFLTAAQWGDPVRVMGLMITPDTSYAVQADCGGSEGLATPQALIATPRLGDTVGAYVSGGWQPPNGLVTFLDVAASVDRFRGAANAPSVYAADLFPCTPDLAVNFLDISGAVDGFRGLSYRHSSLCPGPCW